MQSRVTKTVSVAPPLGTGAGSRRTCFKMSGMRTTHATTKQSTVKVPPSPSPPPHHHLQPVTPDTRSAKQEKRKKEKKKRERKRKKKRERKRKEKKRARIDPSFPKSGRRPSFVRLRVFSCSDDDPPTMRIKCFVVKHNTGHGGSSVRVAGGGPVAWVDL